MTSDKRQVELLEKNKPRQERAKRTYEAILCSAAELLVEVGVERISTNLIAERAGITVPALYRYFPNKYAVLHALGAKLMDLQNVAFQHWLEEFGEKEDPVALVDSIYYLLKATYDATLQQNGGLEINQSLRAVAPLQDLLLTSHRLVSEELVMFLHDFLGAPLSEALALQVRVTVDTGYSLVEMVLADKTLDADKTLAEGARMLRLYWAATLQDMMSGAPMAQSDSES